MWSRNCVAEKKRNSVHVLLHTRTCACLIKIFCIQLQIVTEVRSRLSAWTFFTLTRFQKQWEMRCFYTLHQGIKLVCQKQTFSELKISERKFNIWKCAVICMKLQYLSQPKELFSSYFNTWKAKCHLKFIYCTCGNKVFSEILLIHCCCWSDDKRKFSFSWRTHQTYWMIKQLMHA
jgi:hypothetical protein